MPAEITVASKNNSSNIAEKKPSQLSVFWSHNLLQQFARTCLNLFSNLITSIDPHVFASTTLESQIDTREYQVYLFKKDIGEIKNNLSSNMKNVSVTTAIQALKTYGAVLSPVDYSAGLNDLFVKLQFTAHAEKLEATVTTLLNEQRQQLTNNATLAKQHFLTDLARGIELMPTFSVADWLETLQYYRPFLRYDFYRHILLRTVSFFTTQIDVATLAPSVKKLRDKCIAVLTQEITEVTETLFQSESNKIEAIDLKEDTAAYLEGYATAKEIASNIHATGSETKEIELDSETDIDAEQEKLTTVYAKNPKATPVPSSATPKLLLTGLALALQATAAAAQETNATKTANSLSSDCLQSLQSVCSTTLGQSLLLSLIAKNNELQKHHDAIEIIDDSVKSTPPTPSSKKNKPEKTTTYGTFRQRRTKRDSNEIPPYQEPFQVNQIIYFDQINPTVTSINGTAIHAFQTIGATTNNPNIGSIFTDAEGHAIVSEFPASESNPVINHVYPVVVANGNKVTYFYNTFASGSGLVALSGRTAQINLNTSPTNIILDSEFILLSSSTASYRDVDAVPIPNFDRVAIAFSTLNGVPVTTPVTANIAVTSSAGIISCNQAVSLPNNYNNTYQLQPSIDYYGGQIAICWENVDDGDSPYYSYCQQFDAQNCNPINTPINIGLGNEFPKIKSLSTGKKVITYTNNSSVYLVRYDANLTNPTTPSLVAASSYTSSIAITSDDKVIVVYENLAYGPPRLNDVFGRLWDPSTRTYIGNPFVIHNDQVNDLQQLVVGGQIDFFISQSPRTTVAYTGNNRATAVYSSNPDNSLRGVRARNLIFEWGINTPNQLTSTQGIPFSLSASIPTAWNPSSQLAIELVPPTGSLIVTATPVNTAVNGNNSASILISGNSYDMNAEIFPNLQVIPELYSRQPYTIQWRLIDTSGFSQPYVTATSVSVTPVCSPPFADATQVQPQRIGVGARYTYQIPASTFVDPNNETLTYTAYQINGAPLPAWLRFDDQQVLLYSVTPPTSADEAAYQIQVTATNTCGFNNSVTFDTTISPSLVTSNLYQTIVFTPGEPIYFDGFAIATASTDPINVTLTLSDPSLGVLSTPLVGATQSTYNSATGVWNAYGSQAEVNALNVSFTGATYSQGSLFPFISDGYNQPDAGVFRLVSTPAPTTANRNTRNTGLIAGTTAGVGALILVSGIAGFFGYRAYQAQKRDAATRADRGDRSNKFAALLHDELAVSNISNFNADDGYLFLSEAQAMFNAFPNIHADSLDDVELALLAKATAETIKDMHTRNADIQLITRDRFFTRKLQVSDLSSHRQTICANAADQFERLKTQQAAKTTQTMELMTLNRN